MSGATLLAAEGHGSERSCARVEGEGGGGEGGQPRLPYPAPRQQPLVLARRWARAARAWLRSVPGERGGARCPPMQQARRYRGDRGDQGNVPGRRRHPPSPPLP